MMPWEKPPVQEPDYNEIPDFLRRTPVNREDNLPTKDQVAPLPWEPNFLSRS